MTPFSHPGPVGVNGVLSAEATVKIALESAAAAAEEPSRISINLSGILAEARRLYSETEASATKPGRRKDDLLRVFIGRLINIARADGAKMTLPSNDALSGRTNGLLPFIKQAIEIASHHGMQALQKSSLTTEEADDARTKFGHYSRQMNGRALLHYVRELVKAQAREPMPARPREPSGQGKREEGGQ